jgi:hypothetical protein
MCRTCSGNDPEVSKQNFYKNINALGGKVIGEYKGKATPVECICKEGHICNPRPNSLQQGQGICRTCSGNDTEVAKQNFYKNVTTLRGKVIGEYKRSDIPVECICKEGHVCNPRPSKLQQGGGMCRTCIGKDPKIIEKELQQTLKSYNWIQHSEYKNRVTKILLSCPKQHEILYTINQIRYHPICRKCDPLGSKGALKLQKAIEELIGEEYVGECEIHHLPKLRYDYTFVYNGVTILTEFHGQQHDKPVSHWHGDDHSGFYEQRQRDLLKRKIVDLFPEYYRYISFSYHYSERPVADYKRMLECFLKSDENCSVDEHNGWLYDEPDEIMLNRIEWCDD